MRAKTASTRRKAAPTFAVDKRIDAILAIDDGGNRILSPEQLGAWWGVSAPWLALRRMQGIGPPFVKDGNFVGYPQDQARQWLKDRRG